MAHASGASGQAGCGPYFWVDLRCDAEGRLSMPSFQTVDCVWAMTVGNALTSLVQQAALASVSSIDEKHILSVIGEVPKANRPYVTHAINALRDAVRKLNHVNVGGHIEESASLS